MGSCTATRPGGTMSPANFEHYRPDRKVGYRGQGLVFHMLPKGDPIPPSGPSKRQNSFVDSSPQN
ncbi:hypothetical protein Acr_13g0017210 [Actinidia rufa]|uniref:Uncharacterized protein n=1 Tax=Actinidia rufa TaxID=165716 RepID=A0A7J0FNM9_9ERIC|nr:hypothetical protein Acr_13g0017210 [Actinidia rufa]